MKMLFISHYPNEQSIADGMAQRIKNVDNIFINQDKIYLQLSLRHNFKKSIIKYKNIEIVKLNYILHFFDITKYIKNAKLIYVHSIYNYWKLIPFIKKTKNTQIILDAHGAVPEEINFTNKKIQCFIYNKIERLAFRRIDLCITVNQAMKNHFSAKYNKYKGDFIICPILSINVFNDAKIDVNKLKKSLNINSDTVVFIYSGNTQKWQNIQIMLEKIKSLKTKKYKFIILTKEINIFQNLLLKFNVDTENVILKNISPEKLGEYYQSAHYGFVLRDEHVLNKVACPTKLVEYLYYGIIPIVKFDDIGDFKKLGYEYIKIENENINMDKNKSQKNIIIAKNLLNNNKYHEIFKILQKTEVN